MFYLSFLNLTRKIILYYLELNDRRNNLSETNAAPIFLQLLLLLVTSYVTYVYKNCDNSLDHLEYYNLDQNFCNFFS